MAIYGKTVVSFIFNELATRPVKIGYRRVGGSQKKDEEATVSMMISICLFQLVFAVFVFFEQYSWLRSFVRANFGE